MLHLKFHGQRSIGSGEEFFEGLMINMITLNCMHIFL